MRFPVLLGAFVPLIFSFEVVVQAQNPNASISFEVYPVIQSDVSPRLSALSQHVPPQALANMTRFLGHIDADAPGNRPGGGGGGGGTPDPALQTLPLPSPPNYTFVGGPANGVGVGFSGFTSQWAPPDTNMAVGKTHPADLAHSLPWGYYVQWVNTSFAVFDKSTDGIVAGPLPGSTPWADWSNGCATNNDGDPIIQYDRQNDRWIFTQFSISTKPYLQCFAISTGADPQGPYFRFAINFGSSNFPDYPKLGIWPTGYFMSFNIFKGSFQGPEICAIDRAAVVSVPPTVPAVVCAQLGASAGSLLPADQDGLADPGFPELFMGFSSNSLKVWSFTPNYVTASSSTLTGPSTVPVGAFTTACSGGACIPQPNTSELLDSLADRLMYRLAYRKVGTTDYLVANHSVNPNKSGLGVSGIRWYQLTATGGNVALVQQGTYAIDSNARWMGSIAMDKCGDIGVGYSVSGSGANGVKPGIRFAGRVQNDALTGTVGSLEQEIHLVDGTGSQTSGLNRWGDYSAMRVDPSDDKTFYYTTEYLKNDGTFNWSTAISKIQFSTCR